MKLTNIKFLATANIKGNKNSFSIKILMIILVLAIVLIPSFSSTVTNAVNEYKEDFRARSLELDPWDKNLTEDILESIRNVEHVQEVSMLQGMREQYFTITNISDNDGNCEELQKQITDKENYIQAWSLIGSEKRSVIAGKSLDKAPTFSCIIPSLFYPFEYEGESPNGLNYIDGESLIGKTITVVANDGESYDILYNYNDDEMNLGGNEWVSLPAIEYQLEIVGVYYASPTGAGYYDSIFVSEETGRLITEMALKKANYNLDSDNTDVEKWWSTPSLRTHYVVVDDYANISEVYNKITDMGVVCADEPEIGIKESVLIISKILNFAGIILFVAPTILFIINLIQYTINSLKKRKGEIGLLKAIGYKNSHIFLTLFYEQITLTIKGFFIGGVFSTLFILISNLINSNKDYVSRLFIVDWSGFVILLIIALFVAVTIPLVCQLITLNKLAKIQPKEAMNDN